MNRVALVLSFITLSCGCGSKAPAETKASENPKNNGGTAGPARASEEALPGEPEPFVEAAPAPAGSGLSGVLQDSDADGAPFPLAGAAVAVVGSELNASATSAEDGSFTLQVPDGAHWLLASAEGHWGTADWWTAPQKDVRQPALYRDDDVRLASLAAAKGSPLDVSKGILRIFLQHETFGVIPSGMTLSAGASGGALLLTRFPEGGRGEEYTPVAALPEAPEGFHFLELVDVAPGLVTLQIGAPEGLHCAASSPGGSAYVAPKVITSLVITCK